MNNDVTEVITSTDGASRGHRPPACPPARREVGWGRSSQPLHAARGGGRLGGECTLTEHFAYYVCRKEHSFIKNQNK